MFKCIFLSGQTLSRFCHGSLHLFFTLTFCFVLNSFVAQAETGITLDPIIISANRYEHPLHESTESVSVVTAEDIQNKKATSVAEALSDLTGVHITSLGSPGDDLDVRIRGSDRDEVLVLLDGIPLNNVIEARALLLNSLPVTLIDRIEIVRGAQSVLYGGSAGGGVINVITKKAKDKPRHTVSFDVGNLATFQESVTTLRKFGIVDFALGLTRQDKGGRFENDRYGASSVFLSGGVTPSEQFQIRFHLTYLDQSQDLAFGSATSFANFPTVDYYVTRDLDRHLNRRILLPQSSVVYTPTDWVNFEFSYGFYNEDQDLLNSNQGETPPDPAATLDSQDFTSNGKRHHFDLKNTWTLLNQGNLEDRLIVGTSTDIEFLHYTDAPFTGDVTTKTTSTFPDSATGQKDHRQNYAGYILNNLGWNDRVYLSLGLRYDHNSTFGSAVSPRASLSYTHPLSLTKVFGGFSEGFYAPTINQYYLALVGSTLTQRLEKELSHSFEVGFEQPVGDIAQIAFTYFYTSYENLIDEVQLVDRAHVSGLESSFAWQVRPWIKFTTHDTLLKTQNEATGGPLSNRPGHRLSEEIDVNPIEPLHVLASAEYVSSRVIPNIISTQALGDLPVAFFDGNGVAAGSHLPSYITFNLASSYTHDIGWSWLDTLTYSLRLNNLLNKDYQEKFGYPMPKFSVLAGVEGVF